MSDLRKLLDEATPGPWACHFGDDNINCNCRYILGEYGGMGSLATIDVAEETKHAWGDDIGPNEDVAKANARLIAIAPDLAAALLKAEEALDDAIRIAARNEAGPDLDAARATLTEIRKLIGAK